jgi:predicted ArsR family transcriptional regulator
MPGEGRHLGPRRDTRRELIILLSQAQQPLTTPQIGARLRLARSVAFTHLRALEAMGLIKRLDEGPGRKVSRWYWYTGLEEHVAD